MIAENTVTRAKKIQTEESKYQEVRHFGDPTTDQSGLLVK